MEKEEILKKIQEWAEGSHSYLSVITDYARGYKDGISRAKDIILDIIENDCKERFITNGPLRK